MQEEEKQAEKKKGKQDTQERAVRMKNIGNGKRRQKKKARQH